MIETTSSPDIRTREDLNPQETSEWLEAFDQILEEGGTPRAAYLLARLTNHAALYGVTSQSNLNTPFINTIPVDEEVPYPGDRFMERCIKSLVRWNAMCMVVRSNKYDSGIGGHISTYASLATLKKSATTISSTPDTASSRATSCISRDMLHPASTPAHIWR